MDWKEVVRSVAPALGTLALGPLGGGVVKVLADKVLGGSSGDEAQDEAALAAVMAGPMTPELRAKIIESENAVKTAIIAAGIREKEIDAETERAYLADVQQARDVHRTDGSVMVMASWVLIGWLLLTLGTLGGLFAVLMGGIRLGDVGIVATVFTVIGSTLGYVSNSAQQVLSYYFGSSRGSAQKTSALTTSVISAATKGA